MRVTAIVLLIINLNTASVQQLQSLPGIGPALARRIVDFREKNHGFKRVEELLAVPGISEKRWRAIRDKVEITPVGGNQAGVSGPHSPPRRGGERCAREARARQGGHRIAERASGQQWPQKGTKDIKRFLVLFVPFCG